jgi:hypothetical protein
MGFLLFSLNVKADTISGGNKLTYVSDSWLEEYSIAKADHVTLMLVKPGASFRHKLDEKNLSEVSCIYEAVLPDLIESLISIMKNGLISYTKGQNMKIDIRIGVIFTKKNNILGKAFLEDWGGAHEVNGIFADSLIVGMPNLPNQLRKWSQNVGVSHVENGVQGCQ